MRAHGQRERRGLGIINEERSAGEAGKLCLRDSILFQLYSREAFSKIRAGLHCGNIEHSPQCDCYRGAEKIFKLEGSKSTFWDQYADREDWSGVRFPGGVQDLELFASRNPSVHISAFQLTGSKVTIIWKSQRTEEHTRYIHLVWSQHLNAEVLELESHWYPLVNLSLFCQNIRPGARAEQETCVRCLRKLQLARDKSVAGDDLSQMDGKQSARCRDFGLMKYRDVYCDLETPGNIRLTHVQTRHEEECTSFSPSLQNEDLGLSHIMPPEDLYFQFSKYANTIPHRFTGFWDTETFVTQLELMCCKCELLTEAASSETEINRIYTECQESNHIKQKSSKCCGCSSQFRNMLLNHSCVCPEDEKMLGNCRSCHGEVEEEFGLCEHQKTKRIKKMSASGYSFILMDNYTDKIVYQDTYYQQKAEDVNPIQHFLNTLSGQIIPNIVVPGLEPDEPMKLSDLQEREFQSAMQCYTCMRFFTELKDPVGDKMRDHCHVTGDFRGAACRSCNGKLVLKREVRYT